MQLIYIIGGISFSIGVFVLGVWFGNKKIDEEYLTIENLYEMEKDTNKDLMKKLAQCEGLQPVESEPKKYPFKYKMEVRTGRVLLELEGDYDNVTTEIERATRRGVLYDIMIKNKKFNTED